MKYNLRFHNRKAIKSCVFDILLYLYKTTKIKLIKMARKGRCFKGGYVAVKKTNIVRKPKISDNVLAQFYAQFGVTP